MEDSSWCDKIRAYNNDSKYVTVFNGYSLVTHGEDAMQSISLLYNYICMHLWNTSLNDLD